MRLWHCDIIKFLPVNQLRGQYRECCPLRGLYWGKKHCVIQYIFKYNYLMLWNYHIKVIEEMINRKLLKFYNTNWLLFNYRGQRLDIIKDTKELPNSDKYFFR